MRWPAQHPFGPSLSEPSVWHPFGLSLSEPAVCGPRFDKLSASGIGVSPRFDKLSASGAGYEVLR